jgi:very-short-patch-repair endonuclease
MNSIEKGDSHSPSLFFFTERKIHCERCIKMLIENILIEIKWERRNKPTLVSKGYVFTEIGDTVLVDPKDLSPNSPYPIPVQCDYCGEKYEMNMRDYTKRVLNHQYVKKCACLECKKYKTKETCLMKYGVETNLLSEDTIEKIKKTNLERYGNENPSRNENVKNKKEKTTLERYGAISPTLNDEVRKKQIETNIEKYGHETPLQNNEVKEKSRKTLFSNYKAPTSRTQQYLCNLLNGDINFPVGNYSIDILVDNNIAFEYDGGGHDLQVRFGNVTQEEFDKKERSREFFLKRRGYKIIRLVSTRDKLPNKDILMKSIELCIDYVNNEGTNSEINIDEGYIRFGKNKIKHDFGYLIRMDKEYFERNNILSS